MEHRLRSMSGVYDIMPPAAVMSQAATDSSSALEGALDHFCIFICVIFDADGGVIGSLRSTAVIFMSLLS